LNSIDIDTVLAALTGVRAKPPRVTVALPPCHPTDFAC
jgi:hypothetical protein